MSQTIVDDCLEALAIECGADSIIPSKDQLIRFSMIHMASCDQRMIARFNALFQERSTQNKADVQSH